MRAIGYSTVEDGDEGTLAETERAFHEYCRLNLHQPIKAFISVEQDEGGRGVGYRRMMDYMVQSEGEFLVVVPGARVLGADLESVARSIVELDGLGAKVACVDEEFPDPMQNAFHTLGIKGVSRTRSRRIKESMRARALQGQALGRPLFGYRIGPEGLLAAVKGEAAVVELIFRLYTKDGLGLRLIAQHLNERGISTRRGGNWNVVSIRDILRNPAYTGTYSRYGMRRPNVHEAIIPAEVFRAAQDLMKSRRPSGRVVSSEPFLLSGRAYCAYCGNKMMGVTRRQSWRRKDGRRARGVYRYYQCQSRNNLSLCDYHTWRAPLLESTVLSQLKYALAANAPRTLGGGDESPGGQAGATREGKVRDAERRFLAAMKRYAAGSLGVAGLAEYLNGLDGARRSAASVERPADVEATLANWESIEFETRRAFLADHVARIVVEDDSVQIEV